MNIAVEFKDVWFSYGKDTVLQGINFRIFEGEYVALIGPNGAGKTTILKIALGLIEPQKGKVEVFGKPPKYWHGKGVVGYVPQKLNIYPLSPLTVKEILWDTELDKKVIELLELEKIWEKSFMELSGGQKQRVLLALALGNPNFTKILFLDEPITGLDIKAQTSLYEILKEINEDRKITIAMVSHDVGVITKYASKIICINRDLCFVTDDISNYWNNLQVIYGEGFKVLQK